MGACLVRGERKPNRVGSPPLPAGASLSLVPYFTAVTGSALCIGLHFENAHRETQWQLNPAFQWGARAIGFAKVNVV